MNEFLNGIDLPMTLFAASGVFLLALMAKWQIQAGPFDLRKALIDPATEQLSLSRLGQFVALYASTALLFYETSKGRIQEWLFIGYMAAWAGTYIAAKYANAKQKEGQ